MDTKNWFKIVRLIVPAALVCLGGFLVGTGTARGGNDSNTLKELTANSLRIVNQKGKTVFSVSTDADDNGVIELMSQGGKLLFTVRRGDFGQTGMGLYSEDGKPLLGLGEAIKGGGELKLMNANGRAGVVAVADEEGNGMVVLVSAEGKMREISGKQEP